MIYAAVLAGGSGRRFGSELPKQFLKINGETILIKTVRAFQLSGRFDRVLVCVPRDYVEMTSDLLRSVGADADVVVGGRERFESLENCCRHIAEKYGVREDDILISQDSVRPFTTSDMINDCIDGVIECGFATAAIPSSDTVIQCSEHSMNVPDRREIYCVQTPQGFYIDEFFRLYRALDNSQRSRLTDASKVYILNGRNVKLSLGNRLNIKITTPEDMVLAQAISDCLEKNG